MGRPLPPPLDAALADPWGTLRLVLDGPLHPGGTGATEALLDRAGVTEGTRLLDAGCGAGGAVALARRRGACAVGLDRDPGAPAGGGTVRGDLRALPVRDGSVDVVLAECTLCLSPDLDRSLAEARRVLDDGGRLALSDVVVEGQPPDLPAPVLEALCLDRARDREALVRRIERAGFRARAVRDHRDDLLAMRDRIADRVDYERLLGAFGDRGAAVRDGIEELEAAVEAGRVGYVSLVATREAGPGQ